MRFALALPVLVATLFHAAAAGPASAEASLRAVPKPVAVAKATRIPACTLFVDAAAAAPGAGTKAAPFAALDTAVDAAKAGAVICVAEGAYPVELRPGDKPLTLAGGFASGTAFTERDSARFVSRAEGSGGAFLLIEDPAPEGKERTIVDGFEITGYQRAIVRDVWYSQRFDITNNHIHDNDCGDPALVGAGFSLNNVTGTISGNVFERNACGRGGAGAINDSTNKNRVAIVGNRFVDNAGTEPDSAHGGALYLFARRLTITANAFEGNTVTGWGAGLYLGAFTGGGQFTTATLAWNVYTRNRAGNAGGGLFCDDSATCTSDHEIFIGNCGGNVFLDSGPDDAGPTVARFDHMTNVGARDVTCAKPGPGVRIDKGNAAKDRYAVTNSLFFGNGPRQDLVVSCDVACQQLSVAVTWSMMQRPKAAAGTRLLFGPGILRPTDPRFVDRAAGDLHLKSRFGHWTATGPVKDPLSSPALAKGDPASRVPNNPPRAGKRSELGAFGNSAEASFVR